jgi:hypothetical protein
MPRLPNQDINRPGNFNAPMTRPTPAWLPLGAADNGILAKLVAER